MSTPPTRTAPRRPLGALIPALVCFLIVGAASAQQTVTLRADETHTGSLTTGQAHRYALVMDDAQAAIVSLMRGGLGTDREMNYLMTVLDPQGRVCEQVNTADGASFCYFRSREPGVHTIIVRRWNGHPSGTYGLRLLLHDELAESLGGRIDQLLAPFYAPDRPGAAVAAVIQGGTAYKRTFGLASLEYDRPIRDDTPFELASCSKQFTGYALAMLIEQGLVSPEDDIRKHMPDMPDTGQPVTVRHLIHHLSGIYDYEPSLELAGYPRDGDDLLTTDRILRAILAQPGTYFPPGTSHSYSNSGYVLLGELVASVTGLPFGDWVQQHLLRPANMRDAYVRDGSRSVEPGKAMSYQRTTPSDAPTEPIDGYVALPNYLQAVGAANVHASINDMIQWAINSRNGHLGGAKTAARFRQGILPVPQDHDYLYGLATSIHRGLKREFHQGLSLGYRTGFYHYPDADATVIYLANDGEWRTFYLAEKVAEIVLDGTLRPYIDSPAPSMEPPAASNPAPAQSPTSGADSQAETIDAIGTYANAALGVSIRIKLVEGRLEAHSIRFPPVPLKHIEQRTFESDQWSMRTVRFEPVRGTPDRMLITNASDGRSIRFDRIANRAQPTNPERQRISR